MRPTYPIVSYPAALQIALTRLPEIPAYDQEAPQAGAFRPHYPLSKRIRLTLYRLLRQPEQAERLTLPERSAASQAFHQARHAWQQDRQAHEDRIRAGWTPEYLRQFRREGILNTCQTSLKHHPSESYARPGLSEYHLHQTLTRHFPNLILRKKTLQYAGGFYHPDFLLFDPATRLRIDIELDEPYEGKEGLPIHFVSEEGGHWSSHDTRDQTFLHAGWVVIRFSEEQAARHADGCARVVADVLTHVTGQSLPASLEGTPPCPTQERWTREEANVMASARTRDAYTQHVQTLREQPITKARKVFIPSEHQQRIYDFMERGQGHGLVIAVAGSGKSTTLLQVIRRLRASEPRARILLSAFGSAIARELKDKLREEDIEKVEVKTLNSFGQTLLPRTTKIIAHKDARMLQQAAAELGLPDLDKPTLKAARTLYGLFQSYVHLDPGQLEDYERLGQMYRLNKLPPDPYQPLITRALELGIQTFEQRGLADFNDQGYLPVKLRLKVNPYDYVLVDECQDLTQTQLELMRLAAGATGRLLFVGDPRQAIMGFRGADNDSLRNIEALHPTRLPLTVCYRCPTSHLDQARRYMPEIQAAPNTQPGQLFRNLSWLDAMSQVQEGDLLFARTNANVALIVIDALAYGHSINYQPRKTINTETGEEDLEVSNNVVVKVIQTLRTRSATFNSAQHQQMRPSPSQTSTAPAVTTLMQDWLLTRFTERAAQWNMPLTEYVRMVTDPSPEWGIHVVTAHGSKGLEADRVFVMNYPRFTEPDQRRQAWEQEQEDNLTYVALTRAKHTLYLSREP